jgi:hypothetical protein
VVKAAARWVSPPVIDDGRSRCGDREQAFRWQPTLDNQPAQAGTASGRWVATTPLPRAQRQVDTVLTGDREIAGDGVSGSEPRTAPPADAQFQGFDVDHVLVTRPPTEHVATRVHPSG